LKDHRGIGGHGEGKKRKFLTVHSEGRGGGMWKLPIWGKKNGCIRFKGGGKLREFLGKKKVFTGKGRPIDYSDDVRLDGKKRLLESLGKL